MKRLISAVIVGIVAIFNISAGSPDKQMVFHTAGDDMLVFVKPRKMAKTAESAAVKPLEYDITLSTQTDSVTVTYTLVTKTSTLQTDSTVINGLIHIPNERIYVEPKSKNWIYRLRFKMAGKDFQQTFCGDAPVELSIDNYRFMIPQSKQPKEAEICRTAVTLIEINKKK